MIVGYVRINSNQKGSNGTFITASFTYCSDDISHFYIRFFDTDGDHIVGFLDWGESAIITANPIFGVAFVDFAPTGPLNATNYDYFIIPEPSTAHLVLLFGGLILGMRASWRKREEDEEEVLSESM